MAERSTKDKILEYYLGKEKPVDFEHNEMFTAGYIANVVNASRSVVSQYLNEYHEEGILVKINTRPVVYLHREKFCEAFHTELTMNTYDSIEEAREESERNRVQDTAFDALVGVRESLMYCVEQCKAAISYPGNGLPLLLQGPTGTEKSFIAQLMYDYGVEKGILSKESRFITVNCAEYANNPEFLITNLFGYKKGAYTGADKDKEGLIALADGGVLFMDEVHGLKPECQEKIFLFMDKGIYHMVGDNDTWYHAKVRMIFATTENPDTVLLKTLLRRIPIVVKIPSLQERPVQEKKELIYRIISYEQEKIHRMIRISSLAYQIVESHTYNGNIGELKNCIRSSAANAFLRNSADETVDLHIYDLPQSMLQNESMNRKFHEFDDKTMLEAGAIMARVYSESKLFTFQQQIIREFMSYQKKEITQTEYYERIFQKMEQYIDFLFFDEGAVASPKVQLTNALLMNIFEIIFHKYNMEKLSNNEITTLVKFIQDYSNNIPVCSGLYRKYKKEVTLMIEGIKDQYPIDYNIINDLCQLLNDSLNIKADILLMIDLFMFFRYIRRDLQPAQIPGIIIAHGYSIASSIAEVANQLLRQKIFDAIDMPIESDIEVIAHKLSEYLKRMEGCKEIVVMVDMGSLEDIHEYMGHFKHMDIGIINNVTTKLALDIGSMIMEGATIRNILEEASERNKHNYVIVENREKRNVILSVCETGIGTAEKISDLIEQSFPNEVDVDIIPYDYHSLTTMGMNSPVFEKYHVLFIVGTRSPKIEGIPFISIEELIEQHSMERINALFESLMSEKEIQLFNKNMIKYFSLDNLLSYLTILDSRRIVDSVEEIIGYMQKKLDIRLSSGTICGLYVHISCLIERLIIDKYIINFEHEEEFIRDHQDFIQIVKDSFKDVEECYNVKIPISEIGYLYEYFYNGNSVERKAGSVENKARFNEDQLSVFDEE